MKCMKLNQDVRKSNELSIMTNNIINSLTELNKLNRIAKMKSKMIKNGAKWMMKMMN